MLSYKEYRRLKESNNNERCLTFEDVDSIFKSWETEVVGLIVCPKYTENLINYCENAVASDSKWKTIHEHRMIKQLPAIIQEALNEECAQARLFINEAKYQVKNILKEAEGAVDPWAQLQNAMPQAASSIEKEVEVIFKQLKKDLLTQYGFNRGTSATPAGSATPVAGAAPQKPGLWGRAKNWLKGMWQGATGGDPNLRQFALSKGYQNDPNYQNDPHAWKDRQRFPNQFQGESEFAELECLLREDFEEAKKTFDGVFAKHHRSLLSLVAKYALQTLGQPADKSADVASDDAEANVDKVKDGKSEPELDEPAPEPEWSPESPLPGVPSPHGEFDTKPAGKFRNKEFARAIREKDEDGNITVSDKDGQEYTVKHDESISTPTREFFVGAKKDEPASQIRIKMGKVQFEKIQGLVENPPKDELKIGGDGDPDFYSDPEDEAEVKSEPEPEPDDEPENKPEPDDEANDHDGDDGDEPEPEPDEPEPDEPDEPSHEPVVGDIDRGSEDGEYDDGDYGDDSLDADSFSELPDEEGEEGEDDAETLIAKFKAAEEEEKAKKAAAAKPAATTSEKDEVAADKPVESGPTPKDMKAAKKGKGTKFDKRNLDKVKLTDGKLSFNYRGNDKDLALYHDEDHNQVWAFFQSAGKWRGKSMTPSEYNTKMERDVDDNIDLPSLHGKKEQKPSEENKLNNSGERPTISQHIDTISDDLDSDW